MTLGEDHKREPCTQGNGSVKSSGQRQSEHDPEVDSARRLENGRSFLRSERDARRR